MSEIPPFQIYIRSMASNAAWGKFSVNFSDPSDPYLKTIWERVGSIFTIFCEDPGTPFSTARAYFLWQPVGPQTLNPCEPVVYLIDSFQQSLIGRQYGQFNVDPARAGLTWVNAGNNLSEVYLAAHNDPAFLANRIIHELMHNKLNMDDSMHNLALFVGPEGGFMQSPLPPVTDLNPSPQDIQQMVPALIRTVPQQTGI
jgi:hypothetical protein